MNIYRIAKKEDAILDALREVIANTQNDWSYITPQDLEKKGLNKLMVL